MDNRNVAGLNEINKIYTHKHIIGHYMNIMATDISQRGLDHDNSKLTDEELEGYIKYGPILDEATIGTKEYDESLEMMKEYNDIHYSRNRHHPEYFENGVDDMNLLDIIEMFADWCAVSDVKNTNVLDVMEGTLFERFGIDNQLAQIIINTLNYLKAKEDKFEDSRSEDI